jgi:uncharacterized protein YndB with AHSA1/START domain
MIRNTVFIPAPRQLVFSVLTGYERYIDWLPGCERCSVVAVKGTSTYAQVVVNMARKLHLELRYDAESDNLLRFELTNTKELKTYAGSYRLMDAADGTGTVLFTELDVEVRSIPRFLTDGVATKTVQQAGIALRDHIGKMPRAREGAATTEPVRPAVRRRARRVLQIVKEPAGYRIWFMGNIMKAKNIAGDFFSGS